MLIEKITIQALSAMSQWISLFRHLIQLFTRFY